MTSGQHVVKRQRAAIRWLVVLALFFVPSAGTPHAQAAGAGVPVLAFYYSWYSPSSWCTCRMSDLPPVHYDSAAPVTIRRQIRQAHSAGIDGFISSWWGEGDPTDQHFGTLQHEADAIRAQGGHFTSSIYLEADSPHLQTPQRIATALRYVLRTYAHSPSYFHWQDRPVIFIWDPLGGGRTLAAWAQIRRQVDPGNRSIWSAEGTDTNLLTVFDGLHLFSAANWAIANRTIGTTDASFRAKISSFNAAHGTHRIWAAGVLPGWNDMRVPGRTDAHVVPRNGGATYRHSWEAALASRPDWITITSFNEWFEGSNIEPSSHFHSLYLGITRHYTSG
jgi:hypothetical protein